MVGVLEPLAFSMVMPKPLAAMPLGSLGSTSEAYPSEFGQKVPAGMGAEPLAGITQSSYALPGGAGVIWLASITSAPRSAR